MNWLLIIGFLILGMLMANMLVNVCGCKNVVEGQIVAEPVDFSNTNLLDKCYNDEIQASPAHTAYSTYTGGMVNIPEQKNVPEKLSGSIDCYKFCDMLQKMSASRVLILKDGTIVKQSNFCSTNVFTDNPNSLDLDAIETYVSEQNENPFIMNTLNFYVHKFKGNTGRWTSSLIPISGNISDICAQTCSQNSGSK